MEIVHRSWKIDIRHDAHGLRAFIYRPSSRIAEYNDLVAPYDDGEKALIEAAKGKIDSLIQPAAKHP